MLASPVLFCWQMHRREHFWEEPPGFFFFFFLRWPRRWLFDCALVGRRSRYARPRRVWGDNTTAVTDVFIHALWGRPRDHKWSSPASAAEMWECSINFTVPTRATHDRRPPRPLLQTGKHMWLKSYQPGLLHTRLCLPKSKTRLLINPYLTHKGQIVHSGSETKQKLQLFNADHYHFVLIRSFILFSFFFFDEFALSRSLRLCSVSHEGLVPEACVLREDRYAD